MDLIRVGRVSSVSRETCSCRVTFPDLDDVVSYDLPVIQIGSGATRSFWLPEVDEQVACLFLSSGVECGVIIGSFYTKANLPSDVPAGTIVFTANELRLGADDASDPVVRRSDLQGAVDAILDELSSLRNWASTHTHPAPGGATSAPTAPPSPVGPVTATGSDVVRSA